MFVTLTSPVRVYPRPQSRPKEIGMDLRSTGNVDPEDVGSNPSTEPTMGELIAQRLNRRDAMRGLLGAGAAAAFSQVPTPASAQAGGAPWLPLKAGGPPAAPS